MSIADKLITRGWAQGQFEDRDGRVCIAGAARFAVYGDLLGPLTESGAAYDEWRRVCNAITEAISASSRVYDPSDWNDAPERTFDEVLRVAKQADEILDAAP